MKFPIEVSARHVHLTEDDFAVLFGEEKKLTCKKALSQSGEFLSNERVSIAGVKRDIENVAILGPFRNITQAELAYTDLRGLGINAPVRESGDIKGSAPFTLIGPKGKLELSEGLIVAKRHIHMDPKDAVEFSVINKQVVMVKVSGVRALIFDEVVVRVSNNYVLGMHVDTDEGNAAGIISSDYYGEILPKR